MLLIRNGWLLSPDYTGVLPKVNIVIQDGKIKEISPYEITVSDQFEHVIEAQGKLVMSGLVNSHTHSYANYVKATTENIPLESWMLHIMAQGRCMDPEDIYWNAALGAAEMIKTGTTCCLDHLAQTTEGLDAAMQAYADIGLRATIAPMISDKPYLASLPIEESLVSSEFGKSQHMSVDEVLKSTVALIKKWHGYQGRLSVALGPSGPQRCSDQLLQASMKKAQEYNTIWHSHVLESKIQADTGYFLYGKPMVSHLEQIGCLNERTSLVHAVWLNSDEAELAAARGAVLVHNPASNLILGSGIAPLNMYRKLGLTVALGTDGANCGGNLNLLEVIKLTAMLHKFNNPDHENWITAAEVLRMATINGAQVTLREREIGCIEPGRQADIVILNPSRSPALQPIQNPIWQLVYGESGQGIDTVLVQGRVILENGSLTTLDEDRIYREAKKRSERILDESLKYAEEIKTHSEFINRYAVKKVR